MTSFVSSRHADVRPNPCEDTPFRNDCGQLRAISPERSMLETTQRLDWDPAGGDIGTDDG